MAGSKMHWTPKKVLADLRGGSAVDIKASYCMLSLGSDTGGSVRSAADSAESVRVLKPTYGRGFRATD